MNKETQQITDYFIELLSQKDAPIMPDELKKNPALLEMDMTIKGLKESIDAIGRGDLSKTIYGKGHCAGIVKNLQATLRNFIWPTKAISQGNFSYQVEFLGEFSDAFNEMARKLESTINDLKTVESQLRESEERHKLLADNANDVIWIMDLSGKFTYVSPSVEKLRGFTVDEVMSQTLEELLCPGSREEMVEGLKISADLVNSGQHFGIYRGDIEQPKKDGTTVWTDLTVSGIYNKNCEFLGMLGVSRDITERRKMEDEIKRLMEKDHLTGLYNRLKIDSVLKEEEEKVLEGLKENGQEHIFSIAIIDLDDFKKINDNFGHSAGDKVLVALSELINSSIPKEAVAGRWGGEEFLIIYPSLSGPQAYNHAEDLRKKIEEIDSIEGVKISASFGLVQSDGHSDELEMIIRADQALYRAKRTGKNRVELFDKKEKYD